MKKTLVAVACMMVSLAAYSQGLVLFQNETATRVTYGPGGPKPAGGFVDVGDIKFQLYWAPSGGGSFQPAGTPVLSGPVAGRFRGGNLEIRDAGNNLVTSQIQAQVWAWSAAFNSYAQAEVTPGAYVGKSAVFNITPTPDPITPPTSLTAAGFTGFELAFVVPEPATIALGLLGSGVLFLRRRK
jgi:hypothetical protein